MTILVTGGAGYIGSHTIIDLIKNGYDVVVIDNFSNSSEKSLAKVSEISGKKITYYNVDIRDEGSVNEVFKNHNFDTVMHFAGLKSVSESMTKPLHYYDNNVSGSINLLKVMNEFGVKQFIFSSSATVYGNPDTIPVTEDNTTGGTMNPYGKSKYLMEEILKDLASSNNELKIVSLRYFNPVGAHPSGLIGESPRGTPNNLVPYLTQVAIGKLESLAVFGNDYPTKDGSGVRDFIHVQDLASGHTAALNKISDLNGFNAFNLGTGIPHSVLEIISCFEKVNNKKVPFSIVAKRHGDIAECWSSSERANNVLNWRAKYSLEEMLIDSWNWQTKNPDGY